MGGHRKGPYQVSSKTEHKKHLPVMMRRIRGKDVAGMGMMVWMQRV